MIRAMALAALLALAGAPAGAQTRDTLVAGILRADGIALPFAAYARGRWSRIPFSAVPLSIERYRGAWYHPRPGAPPLRLATGSVVRFISGDDFYEEWGVVTDYAPRRAARPGFPVERAGVVLSQPHPAVLFHALPAGSREARRMVAALRASFDALEAREMDTAAGQGDRTRTGHPLARSRRTAFPLRARTVYRSAAPRAGARLYHVALRRAYPAPRGAAVPCEALSDLEAWVAERQGRLEVLEAELRLGSCTEMHLRALEPFAAVTLGTRTFILAETFGYESSERTVLELGGGRITPALPPP